MEIPYITPIEVNFLWTEPGVHRHRLPRIGKESKDQQPSDSFDGLVTRNTSRFAVGNDYAAGGQDYWGYGMWDSHSKVKNMYSLEREEQLRAQRLDRIRKLGYKYLLPPGAYKTMQAILDDDGTSDELDLDEQANDVELLGQHGMGENVERVQIEEAEEEALEDFGNQRVALDQRELLGDEATGPDVQGEGDDGDERAIGEPGEEPEEDLDAAIPEVGDNEYGYSDEYDEDEYQQGFMAEEEYVVRQSQVHRESQLVGELPTERVVIDRGVQGIPDGHGGQDDQSDQAVHTGRSDYSDAANEAEMGEGSDEGIDMSFA